MIFKIAAIYAISSICLSMVATIVCTVFTVYIPANITFTALMYAALWFAFSGILFWGIQDKNVFSVLAYACFLFSTSVLFVVALFLTEFESPITVPILTSVRISLLVPELILLLKVLNRLRQEESSY